VKEFAYNVFVTTILIFAFWFLWNNAVCIGIPAFHTMSIYQSVGFLACCRLLFTWMSKKNDIS
jgi:hypothetical protein